MARTMARTDAIDEIAFVFGESGNRCRHPDEATVYHSARIPGESTIRVNW